MLKKVWEKLQKNYAAGIAVATTSVTIVYAIIKFIIYTYWSGYFKNLNINNLFMKLDYEGVIYQAFFIFVMLLAVCYLMYILESIYMIKWNEFKEKEDNKASRFIYMTLRNLFYTLLVLFVANYPWVIFFCAWGNLELNIITIIAIIFLLGLFEVGVILYHLIFEKKVHNNETDWKRKLAVGIPSILIMSSLVLSMVYFSGSRAMENMNRVRLVENEQYMITYNDGERYILHKVTIKGNKIIINSNEQKIISNEDVECTVKEVEKIDIAD